MPVIDLGFGTIDRPSCQPRDQSAPICCTASDIVHGLRDLIEHATQRQFVYAHEWQVGDLVMYDNRQTMHRARPFPAEEARDMRRTTLAGDGPTVPQVA